MPTESKGAKAPKQNRTRRRLQRSVAFSALSSEGLAEAARRASPVDAGRRVELPSSPPGLLVLSNGRVRVVRRHPERDVTVAYLGPGEIAGLAAVLEHEEPAVVVAVEHVEAVRVPAPVVRRLLGREPRFASRLLDAAVGRQLIAEDRLQAVLVRPVESRIAEFLLEAAEQHGVPDPRGTLIGVKYTHQEIASYVGSTRETTTLVLGELRRSGLIDTEHRRVVVTDPAGLRKRV